MPLRPARKTPIGGVRRALGEQSVDTSTERHANLMKRGKPEDYDMVPLFAEPPHVKKDRPKRPRSVGKGYCPRHTQNPVVVGIVRGSSHLHWAEHYIVTHAGTSVLCPASHTTLCTSPPMQRPGSFPPPCTCQVEGRASA